MKKNFRASKNYIFAIGKWEKVPKKFWKILGKDRTASKRVFKILAHTKTINSSNRQASHQREPTQLIPKYLKSTIFLP